MWSVILATCFFSPTLSRQYNTRESRVDSIFTDEQLVFASNYNITQILVPADGKFVQTNDIPSIFFTVSDPKIDGGSCIYVLEGLVAFEVLEGGRDSTADYGIEKAVYFGAKDGLYKYDSETLSARKFGLFQDNIIQLQKANGSDTFYILTTEHRVFKLENNATVKTRVHAIVCALEFVLDTSNNIYYIECKDSLPHVVRSNGVVQSLTASILEDFSEIKLLRPAFVMDESVPFFADGSLYILYANGTCERKDFALNERPSAFSVDAALYLVAALDGNIYEFNIMEVLLKSMFGLRTEWPKDVTKMVLSIMEMAKEGVYNLSNLIYNN